MEVKEQETFQQQALEITPPGINFDPFKQPENGEEYLMHMLYERKRCPAVVVRRPKNIEGYKDSNTSSCNMEEPQVRKTKCRLFKKIIVCSFKSV